MGDATDFIPKDAKIEVEPTYITEDVKNFASNDDIAPIARKSVDDYEARYVGQRNSYIGDETGIWNQQDAWFRCGLNDSAVQSSKSIGANEPAKWERAKTGTTQFYRQVRQKAANGYAVQTSKDMPFRYEPLKVDPDETADHTEQRAKTLNLLAKWSMKADRFNKKSIEFWTQVGKYGNTPIMVEWIQRKGRKTVRIPNFAEDGITIEDYELVEFETITENRPTLELLPIEAVMADTSIGDLQSQECVIAASVIGMREIVNGIRTGIYRDDLLDDLGKAQQWDGFSGGFENEQEKKENRGLEDKPGNMGTGRYLKREVFINLPIDEDKETWDELTNIPERYRVTLIGNTVMNCAIARIERNQEPDDTIPIEMIHANPDDSDLLYHISDFEVIRSNLSTETTIIRQSIDNNTLVNKPPLWEVTGEVQGTDRTFGPDARWKVDTPNSIGFLNVRDISQSNMQLLDYLKEDSNTANSIDKNMIGESFGARTSASEAGTISQNSRRPNLVLIEYVLEQFLGFYAQRLKVNWEAYGRKDQVVQITDENDNLVQIRPDNISGEYDIVIDIMDDMKDKAVESQRLLNYAKTMATTPMANTIDWVGLSKEISEVTVGTSKFVLPDNEGDVTENARNNLSRMLVNGEFPQLTDNMNLKKHLEIYKAERTRWTGNEEQNPNVTAVLDQVIAQIEQRIANPAQAQNQAQGQAQVQAPQNEAAEAGQLLAGATGGI